MAAAINILSTQQSDGDPARPTGPYKVLANLVKGLDRIDYPYVVNRHLSTTRRVWVHDWPEACAAALRSSERVVLGPNMWVLPADVPPELRLASSVSLQPCEWARQLWLDLGFTRCPIAVWPVGIDTDEFQPIDSAARTHVLVYHKDRTAEGLKAILDAVYAAGVPYDLVVYPYYREAEYKAALRRARFVIWHGRHESQGLALQEAMACDIPVLVADVGHLSDARYQHAGFSADILTSVTAAPYFDDRCGLKVAGVREVSAALGVMSEAWRSFSPRQYVVQNLSLEGQARRFVDLWEGWSSREAEPNQVATADARPFTVPLSYRLRRRLRRLIEQSR
jgi:glycosyltransferase involved in cell wall biosynthesis